MHYFPYVNCLAIFYVIHFETCRSKARSFKKTLDQLVVVHELESAMFKMSFVLRKHVHASEAVLTSTHNLCFGAKIRKKNVYPCKPQFYYIKVGCKGVYILRTCYPDVWIHYPKLYTQSKVSTGV